MSVEWTQRRIDAPSKPYLTMAEVLVLLDIEKTTLYKMIAERHLPEPVKRCGRSVWTWRDLVLASLLMEAEPRMRQAAVETPAEVEADLDSGLPDPSESVRNRSKSAK